MTRYSQCRRPLAFPPPPVTIFITDTSGNTIYMLTKPYFSANEVYTAANVANVVGLVDLNTGVVTAVATGFKGVHGWRFLPPESPSPGLIGATRTTRTKATTNMK